MLKNGPMEAISGPELAFDERNFFWMFNENLMSLWRHNDAICKLHLKQWFKSCSAHQQIIGPERDHKIWFLKQAIPARTNWGERGDKRGHKLTFNLFLFKSYGFYKFGPIRKGCRRFRAKMMTSSWRHRHEQSMYFWKAYIMILCLHAKTWLHSMLS